MLADFDAQATVAVKDLTRARTFYEQILGLTPVKGDAMRGVHAPALDQQWADRGHPPLQLYPLQRLFGEHPRGRRRRFRRR